MNVQQTIEYKLRQSFFPVYLSVENESHMHRVPANAETHFKVIVVSDSFADKLPVKRHQAVYKVLCGEMKKIHALSLHVYTQQEWSKISKNPASPPCAHSS